MRILKVTRCFYPAVEYGGPIGKVLAIGKGLVKRGHSVTVYTSNLLSPRTKISTSSLKENIKGMQVVYFNSWFSYHWDSFAPRIFTYSRRDLKTYDIVHVYGYRDFLSPVIWYYARKWGIPYVFEPMGMFTPAIRSYKKKRLYDFLLGRRLVKDAQKVIVTAESERQELLSCGFEEGKIFLRRNGLDILEFDSLPEKGGFRKKLSFPASEPLILYLGRIAKVKTLDLLIGAFSKLKIPKARLAFVGPDDGDGSLEELCRLRKGLSLEDKVFFVRPLYGWDKLEAFVDADVVVLPSQTESFGNTAAEAIACGTPVIVTDGCGVAPCVDNRVGLVVKHNENELRRAINRILTDHEIRQDFIRNTHEVKGELSWDEPIEQLDKLYRQIIGQRQ